MSSTWSPVQNITVDDRVSRTQYQYTLEDPDANELNLWTGKLVDKMKQLPQLADVATDQQTGGLAVSLVIDRVTASRLGIAPSTIDSTLYDAYGQRQISTMYTQLNQYHVILETAPSSNKAQTNFRIYIFRQMLPREAPGQAHPRPSHPRVPLPPVQCNHDLRRIHAFVAGAQCALECDSIRRGRERHRFKRTMQPPAQRHPTPCLSARSRILRKHRVALHQSPGPVPGRDRIVQSCAQRRAGRRHHGH